MKRAQESRGTSRARAGVLLVCVACALAGCKKDGGEAAPKVEPVVKLGQENVARAGARTLRTGPAVSGTLQARTAAAVRAEVGGTVLDIQAQQGQPVKRGQVLARIEDATLKNQALAASTAVRAARNALQVAQAEEARSSTLSQQGVITKREFERAQLSRAQAEGQLAQARAQQALAQEQLGRARITAPLDGIVSERQVSAGDVVQPGSPLFTVVDPRTLRLEAAVPAARLDQVKVGTAVEFQVTGYGDRSFAGMVERINPVVDPATGQVRIYVAIPNTDLQLLAGLFAEGRVNSQARQALAVPVDAVGETTGEPTVVRVENGHAKRVQVTLGLRDDVAQQVEIRSGLNAGDLVLLGSTRDELADGTRIEVAPASQQKKPSTGNEGPGIGGSEAPPKQQQAQPQQAQPRQAPSAPSEQPAPAQGGASQGPGSPAP